MNLLPLVGLAVLAAGIAAVGWGARRIAQEALAFTEATRALRSLQPALLELRHETETARRAALRLGPGDDLH